MKRRFLSPVSLLIVLSVGFDLVMAADLDVLWERIDGGLGADGGAWVDDTGDGGCIVVGYTDSEGAGGFDVYLIRIDRAGDVSWQKTFGGDADDWGWSVQQTSDSGYVISGTTQSYGMGPSDVYLIRTDAEGQLQWEKTFGGEMAEAGYSVHQTADDGFIIAGETSSYGAGYNDVYLVKTNSLGDVEWERTFGGSDVDYALSVQQTLDGGYIACGVTGLNSVEGHSDMYLIKTDSEGALEWEKTFGAEDWYDEATSVQQTSDGGYIIAGSLYSGYPGDQGSSNVGLIKTDPDGNLLWQEDYGGPSEDVGRSVQQTLDGGYVVVGETLSYGAGEEDVYVIKTDANGDVEWEEAFGGELRDVGSSVQQTSDGCYLIAGLTCSYGAGGCDVYRIKLGDATPVADAGEDQIVYARTSDTVQVTLDGSGSIDPLGGELTYIWTWIMQDDRMGSAEGVNPTIDLPAGDYVIVLFVYNGVEYSMPCQVLVTVVGAIESNVRVVPGLIARNIPLLRVSVLVDLPVGITRSRIKKDQLLLLHPSGVKAVHQRVVQWGNWRRPRARVVAIFNKAELMGAVAGSGDKKLQFVGQLKSGEHFYGTDTIRVIGR